MRYKTVPGYVVRELPDESLLIPVGSHEWENTRMAIMNPVGQFLWEQLQQARTPEELTAAVCGEFTVDEATAAVDIREFLNELERNHCLVKMEE